MERPSFGIKVTYDDKSEKVINDISLPVLRGSIQSQKKLSNVNDATAVLLFEFADEMFNIELTEEQISKLAIQSFNKVEQRKDYSKPIEKRTTKKD